MREKDKKARNGKDKEHDGQRHRDIQQSLQNTIKWAFKRFFAQTDQTDPAVFKEVNVVAEAVFDVIHKHQSNPEFLAQFSKSSRSRQ